MLETIDVIEHVAMDVDMTGGRALATVRRISALDPIPNADRIELATVDGWQVVVAKDVGHKVGDLIIYFEIDSFLPIEPQYEFLRKGCHTKNTVYGEGFRLKTIRLRGALSQGLIMPMSDMYSSLLGSNDFYEGQDVTEILGVKKYEKPLPASLGGIARGNFPSFIPKTDEDRIQNCFGRLKNKVPDQLYEATVKLDGTSFTAYYHRETDRFGVCSRNLDLEETEGNLYWQIARQFNIEDILGAEDGSFAIQGEIIGAGVNGNWEGINHNELYIFNVWDIDNRRYLDSDERHDFAMRNGLKNAPVIGYHRFSEFDSVNDFLQFADGPSIYNDQREGVVFKGVDDPSISFKVISNAWLISSGE